MTRIPIEAGKPILRSKRGIGSVPNSWELLRGLDMGSEQLLKKRFIVIID